MRLWLEAQRDPEKLKVFVTHVLAEPHYVERERIEVHTLQARAEAIEAAPDGVGVLGVSVDVQKDRIETLTVGWGPQQEGWALAWDQYDGDPATDEPWDAALAALKAHPWGAPLAFVTFDTGYLTDHVWKQHDRWKLRIPSARLFGVKGMGGPGRQVITKPGKAADRRKRLPWTVGTDTAKDILLGHGVRVPVPPGGPGALHFAASLDPAFYEQVTAESPQRVQHGGRTAMVWRKRDASAANEGLDLLVYNLGGIVAMQTYFGLDVPAAAARRQAPPPAQPTAPASAPKPPSHSWLPRRRGWL
jgi:phage terminase large subunit GpA-like protein